MLGKFKESELSGDSMSSVIVNVHRSKGSLARGVLRCSSFRRPKTTASVSGDEQKDSAPCSSDRDDPPLVPSMDNTAETSSTGSSHSGRSPTSLPARGRDSLIGATIGPSHPDVCMVAEPSAYDDRGQCPRHPHIQLRKKKMMGGWKVLLVHCPDCCIEEMRKLKNEEILRLKNVSEGPPLSSRQGSFSSRELDCKLDCSVEETCESRVKAKELMRSSSLLQWTKSGRGRGRSNGRRSNGRTGRRSRSTLVPISEITIESVSVSASEITYDDYSSKNAARAPLGAAPSSSLGCRSWYLDHSTSDSTSGHQPVTRMLFSDGYGDDYCGGPCKRGGQWSRGLAGGAPGAEERESRPEDELISLFSCTRMQSYSVEESDEEWDPSIVS